MGGWISLVAVAAIGNSIQCLLNENYPRERIYLLAADNATPLVTRVFGTWTLLAAIIRLAFVFSPRNQSLYVATFISFVIAFYHFASEVFVYKTAPLCAGTIAPLIVSGISMIWMIIVTIL